ncbi:MAG: beta-propeller domain-containing protein [Oscillospiraceae bacterium]|nr:beta-propeller domain-containing protein [Oscillospiraceae bacterium]
MKFRRMKMILLILAVTVMISGNVWGIDFQLNDGSGQTKKSAISINDITENVMKSGKEQTDYIGFYVENPTYILNGEEKQIDANNKKVFPYMKNGNIYIPVRCIAEALGGSVEWDVKTNTAAIKTENGDVITIAANSNVIKTENKDSEIKMDANAELIEGRLYAPAASLAEAYGKNMLYEQGLIIISYKKYLPDDAGDKAKIDAFIDKFTGITAVGSKEKLAELLGYKLDSDGNIIYPALETTMVEYTMPTVPIMAAPETTQVTAPVAAVPATEATITADTAMSASNTADYSTTNIQVQGVDEADIIKTDGQYIYYVRNQTIEIVKTNSDGSFEYMSSFKFTDKNNFNFSDIFIDGARIIAIGNYYGNDGSHTKAAVISTEDKKNPTLERSVEVKGNYITSRKIGNSIYLAANSYFGYGNDWEHIMPTYMDTAVSTSMREIGYDRLYCFPVMYDRSMTTLVGFNIDRPEEEAFIETFLGCGNNIYMSENAMYIAAVNYNNNGNETVINKFAADDGKLVFVKSGTAPGTILNQFSMDEYQSYFRVATNNYKYNGLYVFDNTMQIVGKINDIAPGENIYSTRFMGNRAFVVTFRTLDPLFAIDLSNPEKPVVMGALKIPGYSNYLQPYDENHLIGFGKDTEINKYGGAYYTGMKISLFDVTDITNPIEMFVETIGVRGTDSELLTNHKALLFSKEKGLLAFPVTVYETPESGFSSYASYGTFTFSGAYVYDISLTDGFKLKAKISHMTAQDMLKASDYWSGNPDLAIHRLLTIGDKLYAASNEKLTSYDLKTVNQLGEVDFDNNNN